MKFKFMHINKTAGQSVVKWFHDNGKKIQDYQDIYRNFDNSLYFTIVRNPYDRVASQFFHWKDNLKRIKPEIEFNFYIENLYKSDKWLINGHHPWYHKRFNLPCSYWIKSDKYKIFKFENLSEMKEYFTKHHGFIDNFPHINKTKSLKTYKQFYDEKTIQTVQQYFESDFLNFGYEK